MLKGTMLHVSHAFSHVFRPRMGVLGSESPLLPAFRLYPCLANCSAYSPESCMMQCTPPHVTCPFHHLNIRSGQVRSGPGQRQASAAAAARLLLLSAVAVCLAPTQDPSGLFLNPPQPHSHKTSFVTAYKAVRLSRGPFVFSCPSHAKSTTSTSALIC